MSRFRNVLTTTAILVGSSAALLTGGIAKADPAPAPLPVPAVPGLNLLQDLIDPAKAPQLLQAASAVLSGVAPAASPAAPVAPAPIASASVNLPQQPAAGPGAVPATLPGIVPATVPATTAPAVTPAGGIIPSGQINLPSLPGLPIPLPQQLTFPGDLASLIPGAPGAAVTRPGMTPAPAATSPMPGIGALFPTSALP